MPSKRLFVLFKGWELGAESVTLQEKLAEYPENFKS